MASKMRRSTENEYGITEKHLRVMEGTLADVSPERVQRILKKLPPFVATDVVDLNDVADFN